MNEARIKLRKPEECLPVKGCLGAVLSFGFFRFFGFGALGFKLSVCEASPCFSLGCPIFKCSVLLEIGTLVSLFSNVFSIFGKN